MHVEKKEKLTDGVFLPSFYVKIIQNFELFLTDYACLVNYNRRVIRNGPLDLVSMFIDSTLFKERKSPSREKYFDLPNIAYSYVLRNNDLIN